MDWNINNSFWIHKSGEDTRQTPAPKTGQTGKHREVQLTKAETGEEKNLWEPAPGEKTRTGIDKLPEAQWGQVSEWKNPGGPGHKGSPQYYEIYLQELD